MSEPTRVWKLPASCCTLPEGSEECKDLKTVVGGPVGKYANLVHTRVSWMFAIMLSIKLCLLLQFKQHRCIE